MPRTKGASNYSRYKLIHMSFNTTDQAMEDLINEQAVLRYELHSVTYVQLVGIKLIFKKSWQ